MMEVDAVREAVVQVVEVVRDGLWGGCLSKERAMKFAVLFLIFICSGCSARLGCVCTDKYHTTRCSINCEKCKNFECKEKCSF